ncbi:alpha/beta hydrolase [uncultured Enterococcus sp.]|uniref:alpha/beta fold hydrolase n=1 Tax=uncultured Enterococcus sp. TaxID=167972 RepID=UPI002AA84803|nr:alpha/beta hydrolase [uncultured Enterococcus sp.]
MKIEEKSIIVADGSVLFYKVSGAGFPLFLLHGNGGSGEYFIHQVPVFSRFFKVYTVDLRGHGHSTNTQAVLSFKLLSDDLYLITEKENIHSLDILGFSDGANIAMRFAADHPEMVRHLVLNAGNTEVSGMTTPVKIGTQLEYLWFKLLSPFSRWRKRAAITVLMLKDTGITESDLNSISAKTMVLVGKRDVIKLKHSMYIAESIPEAVFVLISGQGHLFALKNPKLFNEHILSFLLEKQVKL